MVGGGLVAAEGTSCEKMAVVPVEVPRAASRTTQGPASQPTGRGLEPQRALGSAWGPGGHGEAGSAFLVTFPESPLLTVTVATVSELIRA